MLIQEEQQEFDEFMIGLSQKIYEISQDYENLSENNKIRVRNELDKIITLQGITGVLQYLKMKK